MVRVSIRAYYREMVSVIVLSDIGVSVLKCYFVLNGLIYWITKLLTCDCACFFHIYVFVHSLQIMEQLMTQMTFLSLNWGKFYWFDDYTSILHLILFCYRK